jgi:predicted RNA-binding Zn ribbon-like protein
MVNGSKPSSNRRVLRRGAESLCLDFVNTVAWRLTDAPEERLASPAALLDWCIGADLIESSRSAKLRELCAERPGPGTTTFRRAVALREAIYRIFRATIYTEDVPEDALQVLNLALSDAPPRVCVAPTDHAFGWRVGSADVASEPLLAPIAWSAADLLTGPRIGRVRQCEDDRGCGWLFLDESRTGTRRWCSMGDCGNRAKARRHRERTKQPHLPPASAGSASC